MSNAILQEGGQNFNITTYSVPWPIPKAHAERRNMMLYIVVGIMLCLNAAILPVSVVKDRHVSTIQLFCKFLLPE